MNEAKFLRTVTVIDLDSGLQVELCVFKHCNGGMFAIDSSFVDQVLGDEEDDELVMMNDPLDWPTPSGEPLKLLGL